MAIGVGLLQQKVLAFDPSQLAQAPAESREVRVWRDREPADARPLGLRPRRKRPCRRCAAERDELASPHSITSSARSRVSGGMTIPSTAAVLRFKTNSNFVGRSIGVSARSAPRRILATMTPAWRK